MGCPAFAKLPGVGHALGDLPQLHAGSTKQTTHAVAHDVRKHRTERLIVRSHLVDQGAQRIHRRFGGTIDTGHAQLGADVHEQLVATGGDTVGQRIGGVGITDLIRTHLGGIRQQHADGIGCLERDIRYGGTGRRTSRGCGSGSGRSGSGRSGSLCNRSRRSRGLCGGSGCRSTLLNRFIVGFRNQRIGIGHVYTALVATDVVHGHVTTGELRQTQGLGTEVGQRRRIAEAHLHVFLDTEATLFGGTEQQRLGFDPAHRGCELPAQQFGEQQSAELLVVLGIGVPHLRIVQRGLDAFGRHDFKNLGGELLGHLERHGDQVRNVAADQTATVVDVLRQQRVELVAELRHALPEQCGMERHVDARHQHERRLAAVFGHATGGIGLQRLQTGDGAGDGILLASQVVVHDLQELAGLLGHGLDVLAHAVVAHTELVRTQRTHAVVGASLLITRNEMMHGGATVEHEFEHGFQRNHAGKGAQRIVFAQRMAREVRRPDVGAGLAQARGLCECHGGERHLGELGEVKQAFRMTVGHAVGGQFLRVVAHDGEDRESELLAGELVGALPHVAGGRGLGTLVKHHALLLDALARVDECGLRRTHDGGGAGDDVAVDTAGHFEHHAGVGHTADTFDGDLHLVVELHHAVHVVGPAGDLIVGALLVQRLHGVLGGGGQPHAVDQRGCEPGDRGATVGGVDRVEIAGGTCECGHLVGCGHGDATQHAARRAFDFGFDATIFRSLGRQRIGIGTAADGEALGFVGQQGAVFGGVLHMNGHHASGCGFEVVLGPAGELDGLTGVLEQFVFAHFEFDEMIEVHCVEQAFDDREAVDIHGPERGVDRRPCRSDERVRRDTGRYEVAASWSKPRLADSV